MTRHDVRKRHFKTCSDCGKEKALTAFSALRDSARYSDPPDLSKFAERCMLCVKRRTDLIKRRRLICDGKAPRAKRAKPKRLSALARGRRNIEKRIERGDLTKRECFVCGSPNTTWRFRHFKKTPRDIVWICKRHEREWERYRYCKNCRKIVRKSEACKSRGYRCDECQRRWYIKQEEMKMAEKNKTLQFCRRCGIERPAGEFYRKVDRYCIPHYNERARILREWHREGLPERPA